MTEFIDNLVAFLGNYYIVAARFLFALIALYIFTHIRRGIMREQQPNRILAVLDIANGSNRLPVMHYETTIGRSKSCDVVIPLMFISRQHAVLSMTEKGRWRIWDTKSRGGILINGRESEDGESFDVGDEISLAGVNMALRPPSAFDQRQASKDSERGSNKFINKAKAFFSDKFKSKKEISTTTALLALNLFQLLACLQLSLSLEQEHMLNLAIAFAFLFCAPWASLGISKLIGIKNTLAQTAAFFLTTLGFCTTLSAVPSEIIKLLCATALGLVLYFVLCLVLKNLDLVMKLRNYTGAISLLVLGANLVFGSTINGQRNWVRIGSITVQPSEFIKVLFVFTGSATLAWLLTSRNLTMLTVYAAGCIGMLALMGDFGTALIFFFTFIVLIFMTSGDIRAIVLTCVSAVLAGLLVISFKPYITDRFSVWGNVWEHVNDTGFQQTRSLMAIASGGLLGLGAGNGFLKSVFAADTDLVFGLLCEEWGLLIGVLAVGCYILLLLGSIRSRVNTRSSYYVIAACAAASVFLFQASLNIFGTVDILPITGVTLPFVSNGGSSTVACWGLLSFITAAANYTRKGGGRL